MPGQSNTRPSGDQSGLGPSGWAVFEARGLGSLWMAWVDAGLAVVQLDGGPPAPEALARWLPEMDEPAALPERPLPTALAGPLEAYFAGEPVDPAKLPARLLGTRFQIRAWEALRRVPRGRVRTYAGLARDIQRPRSMRAIGTAMRANPIPIVVPCHRVVAAGHALGGYSGGPPRKQQLLALEGVEVQDGVVIPGQLPLPE